MLADGTARPEETAIAAASPAAFDDPMKANLPFRSMQGVKAVTQRDGQVAAALADILVKGLSQERVRRLLALLKTPALEVVPREWARVLPPDAPSPN